MTTEAAYLALILSDPVLLIVAVFVTSLLAKP